MIYLNTEELLLVAQRACGAAVQVRELGLLEAAAARPQATLFGQPAYSTLPLQAAALCQSLALNRALVDGNKRLALAGLIAFLGMNGYRLSWTNDQAYGFILGIITKELPDLAAIAREISEALTPFDLA